MQSYLKLYNIDWSVTDNYAVENIGEYLDSLTPIYQDTSFQYIRPTLNVTVKIALPTITPLDLRAHSGYAIISDNTLHMPYYYYVMNVRYIAPQTAELELGLDTINTFWSRIQTQLTTKDRHLIHRQHKDRFLNAQGVRKLDRYPEDFQPLLLPASKPGKVTNTNDGTDRTWYLVYKTDNSEANSAVSCYAYCKPRALYLSSAYAPAQTVHPSDFLPNVWYYLVADDDCQTPGISWGAQTWRVGTNNVAIIGIRQVNSTGTLMIYTYNVQGTRIDSTTTSSNLTLKSTRRLYYNTGTTEPSGYLIQIAEIKQLTTWNIVSEYTGAAYVENVDAAVDRTDPTIIKILELPYAPFKPTFTSGRINLPSGWTYDTARQAFKLNNLGLEFEDKIQDDMQISPLNSAIKYYALNPLEDEPRRGWQLESKLYTSPFYSIRFLYDTNTWEFKPEYYDAGLDTPGSLDLAITYKPSNGINSTNGFKFEVGILQTYDDNNDYPGFMICSRNNEQPIYTSEYLNYLKYGMGFDRLQVGENIAKSIVSWAGTAAAGAIGGFIAGGVPGAVVGAIASSLVSGVTTGITIAQQVQQQQQKEYELQHQATSVSGNNDLDLFRWYNGNRLCWNLYQPTVEMRNLLNDYFYYFGYADNTYSTIDTHTRYWWNFIQADIIYEDQQMQQEFIEDIKARFQLGVTVMHRNLGKYDWARDRENWEVAIMPKPKFDISWVTLDDFTDETGPEFGVSEHSPISLGRTAWIEWAFTRDGTIEESGSSYPEVIQPGYAWISNVPGQYQYQGAKFGWRVVTTDDCPYATSDNAEYIIQ